ncbi:hypothetical protein NUH88_12130 [Nisaea acidiphila]|uniref:Uncharacterized protein n=1 Tax=Nisaea acidiphila TaxID=1862145 RepID=A0A9J7AP90_9PROT|nr:hypothetical protein [Nisaea acidiphila]UUX48164.1 hypothetical protein NUH88_12130 [Nisaea acidiphila]
MQDVVASQSFHPNLSDTPADAEVTACFSVQASAEPSVMPRVLELFAKLGLIPTRWHSDLGGRRRDELTIDLQVQGLTDSQRDHAAALLRNMVSVTSVLVTEKRFS